VTKNEIKALISLLDDHDNEVASLVEDRIVSLGVSIIPFLEEEWEETLDPDMQKRIEDLIHSLQFDGLQERLRNWKESETQDLLEGMWLVNSYMYPDVELSTLKKQVEQLYFDAWASMQENMHPYDQVKSLNNTLFREKRFSANTKNFHSPANSMMHLALETKRGNPLTLCVIYMIITRKLEMPVFGVNLPNLFILTYKLGEMQFYINVYNKGLILSKADIDNYILQLNLNPVDIFYEPCSNLDIVKRALRNLAFSFEKMDDLEKATEVTKLLSMLSDDDSGL
jgi:regulator of sirC expression with transglutaminase-like and TPR domain